MLRFFCICLFVRFSASQSFSPELTETPSQGPPSLASSSESFKIPELLSTEPSSPPTRILTEVPDPVTERFTDDGVVTEGTDFLITERFSSSGAKVVTEVPDTITERFTAARVSSEVPNIEERKPKITVHPRNITVAEDSYGKFFCSATGFPSPLLVIVRGDLEYSIPVFDKSQFDRSGGESVPEVQHIIGPIRTTDEGWYECVAANYYGTIKSRAYLKVQDLCQDVECKPPKICVQDFDNATVNCQCPELVCERTYEPVCGADCEVHFNPCVWNQTSCANDYDSSGIINSGYRCPPVTEPEIVLLTEDDITVQEGENVVLEAKASGSPEPVLQWIKVDDEGKFLEMLGKGAELLMTEVGLEATGRYVARATNCQTKHRMSKSVRVQVDPLPEVVVSTEPEHEPVNVCTVFGDPHILTFDRRSMHFAGACTYILAMDCKDFSWFAYGLFTYCGVGTCLEEVTVYINYRPIVLARGWIIFIDREKHEFIEGTEFEAGGLVWLFDGLILSGRSDLLGLTVLWDGFVTLHIALDEKMKTELCGVCGNNDNNVENEHLQFTKLEERLIEDSRSNVFVDNWKIDREKMCEFPPELLVDISEPCGNDYKASKDAVEACQSLIDNPALKRCTDTVDLKFYYESCLHDYCYMSLLRPDDDPFARSMPTIAPQCTIARSYATHCELEDVSMRGWDVYMSCEKESTQDAILSVSSYQEKVPFIRV